MRSALANHTAITLCLILVVQLFVLLSLGVACRIGGDSMRSKNMPAGRQAQALGLGYYGAGAFAWLALTWPLMFFAFRLALVYERVWYLHTVFTIVACISFVFPGLLWMYALAYVERHVLHRSSAEQAKAGFKQFLLLSLAEFVILVVLPLALAYIGLVVFSLV